LEHIHCPRLTSAVHGYSMLRTQLNQDYFNDIFDVAKAFHIEIEGHRQHIVFVIVTSH
jgi:hypothetical protein